MRRFECPYCRECPFDYEWNEYNISSIVNYDLTELPEAYDEGDYETSLDCPECGDRVVATDLIEV